jgi:RNA polymerase sigma-70 factor (ECF subfamily)
LPIVDLTHPASHTDAALAQRIAEGDRTALAQLYARESGPVYRYCLALCGNPAWAADAMQDAFLAFVNKPQGYDPARAPLAAYLAGIARHAVLAHLRHQDREMPTDDESAAWDDSAAATAEHEPASLLIARQGVDALMRAIAALPVVFREAVILVELQERSYAEAAAIAGIELNTLRTRLHRGRARLAALLAPAAAPPNARAAQPSFQTQEASHDGT